MYRREVNGSVTYARGCKSNSSVVTYDRCNEYTTEHCSIVGDEKVNMLLLFV